MKRHRPLKPHTRHTKRVRTIKKVPQTKSLTMVDAAILRAEIAVLDIKVTAGQDDPKKQRNVENDQMEDRIITKLTQVMETCSSSIQESVNKSEDTLRSEHIESTKETNIKIYELKEQIQSHSQKIERLEGSSSTVEATHNEMLKQKINESSLKIKV